ncbi:MAG: hypothetical protein HY304_09790 [candidate division Zixibacteria bacterium]|nr:hypothetical protein [candidate division Zixibacteria bacterium]
MKRTAFGFLLASALGVIAVALLMVAGSSAAPKNTPKVQATTPSTAAVKPPASTGSNSGSDAVAPGKSAASAPENTAPAAPAPVTAGAMSNYVIDWYSVNGGGAIDASSASYKMGMSVGQSAAGEATSASYKMGIGFWYGAGCTCTCHADPKCDGVTDILDVTLVIGVAFRGAAEQDDPGCPYARENVDCNTAVDVLDVVHMIKVAFQGANACTEFCKPCGVPRPGC